MFLLLDQIKERRETEAKKEMNMKILIIKKKKEREIREHLINNFEGTNSCMENELFADVSSAMTKKRKRDRNL